MTAFWNSLWQGIDREQIVVGARALFALSVTLLAVPLVRRVVMRITRDRLSRQHHLVVHRLITAVLTGLGTTWVLHELGFSLSVLLGAAGLLTVAIGFAAQTSVANLISGLFLMADQAFVVGDIIEADGVAGEVMSIDLLSVKLRTYDNLMVRLPNEALLKSKVTTLTHYPVRRFDMRINVAYHEQLPRVRELLLAVADANPICLVEPKPMVLLLGFRESAIEVQFSVWCKTENFLELKNTIQEDAKSAFDGAGIRFAPPRRMLDTSAITHPIPVRLDQSEPEESP